MLIIAWYTVYSYQVQQGKIKCTSVELGFDRLIAVETLTMVPKKLKGFIRDLLYSLPVMDELIDIIIQGGGTFFDYG
jgi:hypothetical protein